MNTDVLVVGAGPVGLTMAAELARYGVAVRIVEKAAQRTDKSKALVLWSRTLEMIDRMGCAASFVDAGFKAHGARITAGTKEIARIVLEGIETPHPYALMLAQSETERLMEEHLNRLGVQVERGTELMQFEPGEGSVTATLRRSDGAAETLDARWLVGCDGAHSTVRHGLGMEFEGDTLLSDWILADVHLEGLEDAGEIQVFWHADGILALFPISATRFRIIADAGTAKTEKLRLDPTLEEVQGILERRGPGGVRVFDPVWLAAFRINERKVKDYRAGRIFLAGDAAHVHSPAGGQGMNTGMQDACNLAWKLALVCRGTCLEEPLLSSYSVERSAVGEKVLKAAGRVTTIGILQGEVKQSIRNHLASLALGFAPVRHAMLEAATELSIGYPESPLNGPERRGGGSPDVGERAPIRAGQSPVGSGSIPKFVLFADQSEEAFKLAARHPELLEHEVQSPFHEGGMWLVRPDGYTAVRTHREGWKDIDEYLEEFRKV